MPIATSSLFRELPATPGSVPELRHAVVDFAAGLGASPDVQWAVRLAVSEAVTNVVRHAYVGQDTGTLRVEATAQDGTLVVRVDDDGIGPAPRDDSPGSGFGLALVAHCTVEHELVPGAGGRGTLLRMHFALAG